MTPQAEKITEALGQKLVERLRGRCDHKRWDSLCADAADTIETLAAEKAALAEELEAARAALKAVEPLLGKPRFLQEKEGSNG